MVADREAAQRSAFGRPERITNEILNRREHSGDQVGIGTADRGRNVRQQQPSLGVDEEHLLDTIDQRVLVTTSAYRTPVRHASMRHLMPCTDRLCSTALLMERTSPAMVSAMALRIAGLGREKWPRRSRADSGGPIHGLPFRPWEQERVRVGGRDSYAGRSLRAS